MGRHQPSVPGRLGLVRLRPWAGDRCHGCTLLTRQADAAMLSGERAQARANPCRIAGWLVAGWEPLFGWFHSSARVRNGPLLV